MYVYDLLRAGDVVRPVLVIEAGSMASSPNYALAFNPKRPELLASGDAAGVKVRGHGQAGGPECARTPRGWRAGAWAWGPALLGEGLAYLLRCSLVGDVEDI